VIGVKLVENSAILHKKSDSVILLGLQKIVTHTNNNSGE